jgi:hypothetical protein
MFENPAPPKRQKVDNFKVYAGRTQKMNELYEGDEEIDTEDHVIQRPWEPEQVPTQEEL